MSNRTNENASGQAGVNVGGGQAKSTKQKKALNCSAYHINKVVKEIRKANLHLRNTSGDTQLSTLLKVLQHRGPRGLNTYEGVAAGYLRIATRVKELKDTWEIHTLLEDVIGPDQLSHKGVARYILIGKRKDLPPVSPLQGMEGAA